MAFVHKIDDTLLGELNHLFLLFHFGRFLFGRSQFRRKPLKGDSGTLIELWQVGYSQIASLALPKFVVDGTSFKEGVRSMLSQDFTAADLRYLGLSDVDYPWILCRVDVDHLDSSHAVFLKRLDEFLELVIGRAQSLSCGRKGDSATLVQQLLLFFIPCE